MDANNEWLRVKREIESIWRGAWDAIHNLEDRVSQLEKDLHRVQTRPARNKHMFHPRGEHHAPGFHNGEDED